MALDFDSIATTTLRAVRREMADNIFKANPTVFFLLANGRVEVVSGGTHIDEPLKYAVNGTVKSYQGYEKLNIAPTEEMTTARYNWRQFAGSITMNGLEMDVINDGAEAIFNLMRNKVEVLEESMTQYLDEIIHADRTTKISGKDFLGLDELVEDVVGSSQGTRGGIDPTVHTWWQTKFKSGSLANLSSDMRNFYNTCSRGISKPDYITTTYAVYEAYEDQNAGKQRVMDNRLLDVGFENLRFKGATIVPNENCIAGNMYFLNTRYLRLKIHRNRNFTMTPFMRPVDQDAKTAQILVAGNMTMNNARFQGCMSGLT